jgi:hypothetical protein
VPRFSLESDSESPVSFWGWMFYDSSRQNTRKYLRKKVDEYIRLYVTDLNWVVLECVCLGNKQSGSKQSGSKQTQVVSFHPTLEEAFHTLAAQPLHVVSAKLYGEFMQDMSELAEV